MILYIIKKKEGGVTMSDKSTIYIYTIFVRGAAGLEDWHQASCPHLSICSKGAVTQTGAINNLRAKLQEKNCSSDIEEYRLIYAEPPRSKK